MSAPLVRLMNTIRPLEVTDAAASSVVPYVTRCGASLTCQVCGERATCQLFEESPTCAWNTTRFPAPTHQSAVGNPYTASKRSRSSTFRAFVLIGGPPAAGATYQSTLFSGGLSRSRWPQNSTCSPSGDHTGARAR